MSVFSKIDLLPADPILGIPPLFAADKRENKVNLGVGAYRDARGTPHVLDVVRKAEKILLEKNLNKEYLPIDGDAVYRQKTLDLILGEDSPHKERACAAQTVGGSGALKIGGEFLKIVSPEAKIYLSRPTWGNHRLIFSRCGYQIEEYEYYRGHRLDFEAMKASLKEAPPKSIIILHGSCHNPTGMDPSPEQWKELSHLIKEKELFPFFDLAYQGFGDNLETDAFAIRQFAGDGHEMAIATSHAKNFGLYGERVGHLAFLAADPADLPKIASHIKRTIRSIYSSPPLQGARIVSTILDSHELTEEWQGELAAMRNRIVEMRNAFANELKFIRKPR